MSGLFGWLSDLFGSNKLLDDYELKKIKLNNIIGNPYQPRKNINKDHLEELAQSIDQYGVITPIQVTQTDEDQYQLIAGERRVRASRSIGLEEIPALIRDYNEEEIIEVSFLENLQREPMNPVDIATMYYRLQKEFKQLSVEELGELIGKKPDKIRQYEWILDLPSITQQAISRELIDLETAREIQTLPTAQQKKFIAYVAEENPEDDLIQEKIESLKERDEDPQSYENESINKTLESELGIPGELQERGS